MSNPPTNTPLVGVIMGSDSDLPVMQGAVDALIDFDVPHEVRIISAHRTPEVMLDYARTAAERAYSAMTSGVRCAETMRTSWATPNAVNTSIAACMTGRSESLPMITPTSGALSEATWER